MIAETGAGQHGVATATAAAMMGMECEVFMGKEDTERQALNVYRMRLLGAKVHAVTSGTATLKDAVSETMREWTNRIADTHYVLGSAMGPHPVPDDCQRFSGGNLQGDQGADPGERGTASWMLFWRVSAADRMRSEPFIILSKMTVYV